MCGRSGRNSTVCYVIHNCCSRKYTVGEPLIAANGVRASCEPEPLRGTLSRIPKRWNRTGHRKVVTTDLPEKQMNAMQPGDVPEVVILRLPLYVRALTQLQFEGTSVVSSQQLGERLQMTPAQIRKDLSYFGRFGKQGRGYNIEFLLAELRDILGLNGEWRACLVGVGRLGRAIINYTGFAPEGFTIVAAFDSSDDQVGSMVGDLVVRSMSDLPQTVGELGVSIGIVAVPAAQAQTVINRLVQNGVHGILNYAPVAPYVPGGVVVRNIDPVLSLQSMTFYLKSM